MNIKQKKIFFIFYFFTLFSLLISCNQTMVDDWSTKDKSSLGPVRLSESEKPEKMIKVPTGNDIEKSMFILNSALISSNPNIRNAALQLYPINKKGWKEAIKFGLADPNRGVRYLAVFLVAKHSLCELIDLVKPLKFDKSKSVRAAAHFALLQCDVSTDPTPLAGFAWSEDPEVRGNAVMILGEIGNATAIPILQRALFKPLPKVSNSRRSMVNLQIAEALVKLGHEECIEDIRAALYTAPEYAEKAALAAQMLGVLNDKISIPNLKNLAGDLEVARVAAEVRLVAMGSVGKLDPSSSFLMSELAQPFLVSLNPIIRRQAANTAGDIGDRTLLPFLGNLLRDPDPLVQVSAAGSIIKLAGP